MLRESKDAPNGDLCQHKEERQQRQNDGEKAHDVAASDALHTRQRRQKPGAWHSDSLSS